LASGDCLSSLALQKNPLAYYLLIKSYLLAGPKHSQEAVKASQSLVDAGAGSADSEELMAISAFLAGDLTTAAKALAIYTAGEVQLSHPETHLAASGTLAKLTAKEVAIIEKSLPGTNSPKGNAQHMLLAALLDFFSRRYQPVTDLSKRYDAAYGRLGLIPDRDFAMALTVSGDLMGLHNEQARVLVSELFKREPIEFSTLVLLDSVYFAINRREDGLKLLSQRQPTDKRVCVLARVRVLDDMAQPKDALAALQALAPAAPNDEAVLLQFIRLESELNQDNEALQHLHQYMVKYPLAGAPYFLRAQIYAQKSKWEPASADLTRAINAGYSLVKAVRARAGCYEALGKKDLALDDMNLANSFMQWVR
jgi:tetratricopeptide (TPR) repeat protein